MKAQARVTDESNPLWPAMLCQEGGRRMGGIGTKGFNSFRLWNHDKRSSQQPLHRRWTQAKRTDAAPLSYSTLILQRISPTLMTTFN